MSDNSVPEHSDQRGYTGAERADFGVTRLVTTADDDKISLIELARLLWHYRGLIVMTTVLFLCGGIVYSLASPEWFRADTVLVSANSEQRAGVGEQFGGLAALAGLDVSSDDAAEAIATLKSREFISDFIEAHELLPKLYAETWDKERGQWREEITESRPTVRDAVKLIREKMLSIERDDQTGLVTVSLEWLDSELAAAWVNTMISRLNEKMRNRALSDSLANTKYLQEQLENTRSVSLQQSIGRLLESELQKVMLARGNQEFAFRVIDPAVAPDEPERPRKLLIIVGSTIVGGGMAAMIALLLHQLRQEQEANQASKVDLP